VWHEQSRPKIEWKLIERKLTADELCAALQPRHGFDSRKLERRGPEKTLFVFALRSAMKGA
jgi:hypothetical protein